MPTYYLGLDVHKVRTQYCLMDPAGEILAEGSLPTEEVAGVVPDDCACVLEATGSSHHTYDALRSCAAEVKLAHPSHVKAIASALAATPSTERHPPPGDRHVGDGWAFVPRVLSGTGRRTEKRSRPMSAEPQEQSPEQQHRGPRGDTSSPSTASTPSPTASSRSRSRCWCSRSPFPAGGSRAPGAARAVARVPRLLHQLRLHRRHLDHSLRRDQVPEARGQRRPSR